VLAGSPASAQQALGIAPKHRYRFDNSGGALAAGAQVTDSIGGAHGVVRGAGAIADGAGLRLPGGAQSTAAYIDLPNALVSGSAKVFPGYAAASYEVWITVHGTQNWARVLDFGNNSSDEIAAPGGTFDGADYIMVSASIGTASSIRFERGGRFLTGGGTQDLAGATSLGARMHLVVTYDTASSAWRLYKNGALLSTVPSLLGPSTVDDLNVWLGRSNWSGDNNTNATYEEFRVYDYALSQQQILGNYQAGPDVLTSDNNAPRFASASLSKPAATAGIAYSASLAADATDTDLGDTLGFTKRSGPAWLTVSTAGALGGTPTGAPLGRNSFTVRATDSRGLFAEAALEILVVRALAGGDGADTDSDGLPNLVEHAIGSDLSAASPAAAPRASIEAGKLVLRFTRDSSAADLVLSVLAADAPAGPWTEIARSSYGAPFTALVSGVTIEEQGESALKNVSVSDPYPQPDPAHPKRFLRLSATR